MSRFRSESRITETKFKGDPLIPEPVCQIGPECALRAILYAGQQEMRRVCFRRQIKCDLVFDGRYFRHIYERETRVPVLYDRAPRIGVGLRIFVDLGVQVMSATRSFDVVPVVHLVDFRSYPPKLHPVTGKHMKGLLHSEVMAIIQDERPVLGSFAVDEHFGELGPDEIYDYIPKDGSRYATHCVMFMDGGTDEVTGREYLKFLNSHGPGFGDKGFGRVYFDRILQDDSEFCFHTVSFEDSPTSPQHAPPRPASASSTSDSVAETHAEQKQFGVTPAGLMGEMTQSDHKRTNELQQFLASSRLSENSDDTAMRNEAISKLDDIVKTCVKHIAEKGQMIDIPKTLVLSSGSYSLGVHVPNDELEIICLGPTDVNREVFFETLHDALRNMIDITHLEPLQKEEKTVEKRSAAQEAVDRQRSAARVMKFKLYGKSIVLLYAILSEVPSEHSTVFQDMVLSCIDEASLPILDRCRAADMILKLVPDIENFRTTLRYVNFWARRRGIYSNMTGFIGGIQLAVIVARVCQIYPSAVPSVLVLKVFEEFSRWFWPSPVLLRLIDPKLPFVVWDAPENDVDKSDAMPIITPANPCRNCSPCVSKLTLQMLRKEFLIGFDICKKIKKGEACWSDLSNPLEFFKHFSRYLRLDIHVKDANDLRLWKLKVEPLWRVLPMVIEYHDRTMGCHVHPHEYYDGTRKHCFLFIGLYKKGGGESLLGRRVTTPLPVDAKVLKEFEDETNKIKGPGMEVTFTHHLKERMRDVVSHLVSDRGVPASAACEWF